MLALTLLQANLSVFHANGKSLLQHSGISQREREQNPRAVIDAIGFYKKTQEHDDSVFHKMKSAHLYGPPSGKLTGQQGGTAYVSNERYHTNKYHGAVSAVSVSIRQRKNSDTHAQ